MNCAKPFQFRNEIAVYPLIVCTGCRDQIWLPLGVSFALLSPSARVAVALGLTTGVGRSSFGGGGGGAETAVDSKPVTIASLIVMLSPVETSLAFEMAGAAALSPPHAVSIKEALAISKLMGKARIGCSLKMVSKRVKPFDYSDTLGNESKGPCGFPRGPNCVDAEFG